MIFCFPNIKMYFCKMANEISFFEQYFKEIIITGIIILFFTFVRFVFRILIAGFGKKSGLSKARIRVVQKYSDFLVFILSVVVLITAWGVEGRQAFLVVSSIFTVIGVAMFAQWSVLSNITAGIILFFAFPYRIGDKIYIIDKDNPIEAEIIDIRSFYTLLKNAEGEKISIPNILLLQKGILIRKES